MLDAAHAFSELASAVCCEADCGLVWEPAAWLAAADEDACVSLAAVAEAVLLEATATAPDAAPWSLSSLSAKAALGVSDATMATLTKTDVIF